jgi:16S rRNA (cytosine1402-N4)-methyltransferase
VLLGETLGVLGLEPGMTVVDGTVGAGGHGREIIEAIAPGGVLVGLDRDADILARARSQLSTATAVTEARVRVRFFHRSFTAIREVLAELGLQRCDRVLLDLGVSSLQLDTPERGFSFMHHGFLDMRMDQQAPLTAAAWLARVSQDRLAAVLREYGEERYAGRIARHIVEARERGAMQTTTDLREAVLRAIPAAARRARIHPATRVFQAIRIAVNDELGELRKGLEAAREALLPGGRLAVISFHSLEDRIVKRYLREHFELPFRKPIRPAAAECARNPRARSARLRCGIREAAA